MKNQKVEDKESVESVVANLRDEFVSTSTKPEKLELPKIGKELPTPRSRMRLLNMLSVVVILAGVIIGISLLVLRNNEDTAVSATNDTVLENDPLTEEIGADLEPTVPVITIKPPQTTTIPLPDPISEQLPTAEPYILPEEPPLPAPQINDP